MLNQSSNSNNEAENRVETKIIEADRSCCHCAGEQRDEVLDSAITLDELTKVVNNLPSGKSPREDGLVYEIYKSGINTVGFVTVISPTSLIPSHVIYEGLSNAIPKVNRIL